MPSLLLNKASSDATNYSGHSAVSYVQEENECCGVQGVVQHKAFVRVQSGFTLIEFFLAVIFFSCILQLCFCGQIILLQLNILIVFQCYQYFAFSEMHPGQ